MIKYYENLRHFQCRECNHKFAIGVLKWLSAPHVDFMRYRYVECPQCKARHWLKAIKVVD